jgi:hypothetical protein
VSAATSDAFVPLARGFYLEGLLIDGENVWFTDVITGGVRRVGSDQVLLEGRTMIGGLLLNADRSLLVAGQNNIARIHPISGANGILVDGFQGSNEMCPDTHGGIIFGTIDLPAILRGEKPGPSALYRLSVDLYVTVVDPAAAQALAQGARLKEQTSVLYRTRSPVPGAPVARPSFTLV